MHGIVSTINPRPDTKDYTGNLPLFYTVAKNDAQMIDLEFKRGKEYFHLRNFKNQSIFHIAAKFNAIDAIEKIVGNRFVLEELIKKDFKGDSPVHTAAKHGSVELLEFILARST